MTIEVYAGAPVNSEAERMREEQRRRRNAWEWLRHHESQLARHAHMSGLIASYHWQEIARYERILGLDDEGDAA